VEEARRKDPDGKWIVFHDFNLTQMVIATGAPVLNGNKIIPATFYFRLSGRELSKMVLLRCTPTCEAGYLFTNDYRPTRSIGDLTVRNLRRVAVWSCFSIYVGLFIFNMAMRVGRFSDSMNYVNVARNIAEGNGVTQPTLGFNQPDKSA
jgi:hypothetical protein